MPEEFTIEDNIESLHFFYHMSTKNVKISININN